MEDIIAQKYSEPRSTMDIPDDTNVIAVIQGEVGIIWSKDKKPGSPRYIETSGAGPCIIISAYNPETGKTCLAHIDAMHSIFKTMGIIGKSQIRIIGGWQQSTINEAIESGKRLNMEVLEIDGPTNGGTKSIIIDSETGNIYDIDTSKLRTRPRVQKLLASINPMSFGMEAGLYTMKTGEKPACQWVYRPDDSGIKTYMNQSSFHAQLITAIN